MKYKSVTFEVFKEFRQEVEKQLGKSIKIFRLDRNSEYLSLEFQGYLRDNRILSQWTPPYMPQCIGILEKEESNFVGHSLIHNKPCRVTQVLLGYTLQNAVYEINRIPSKSVDVTPYGIWYNKKPILSYMRV